MAINWNDLANAYIEMQQTGKQAILSFSELGNTDEYFVYVLDLDDKEITLLNIKEQMFGEREIRYDDMADVIIVSEDENVELLTKVTTAILDRSKWVPCHYVEITYDHCDQDRMYLVRVGEHPQLDRDEIETGKYLQYDIENQEFVYVN